MKLGPVQTRVIGSLVEKQLTTPQQYPLSLNSLTLACNQISNREPVANYSETEVQAALDSLKQEGLVRFVLPSHGRSVVRYRHVLEEKLGLDDRQAALVAVLMLRGPQTVGELRSRTERMAGFESIAEVESDLDGLARWEEPLVGRPLRRVGQKEERWQQLLCDAPDSDAGLASPALEPLPSPEHDSLPPPETEWAALREDLAAMRAELQGLRDEIDFLKMRLDEMEPPS